MNPMPACSTHAATCFGDSSIFAPSASSTSALPHCDVTARLPCFATRAPAPAATNAAHVLTLKEPLESPPVPHTSSSSPSSSTRRLFSRSTPSIAAISPGVSPFIRIATRNAPICAGVAAPEAISSMHAAACSAESSSRSTSFVTASRIVNLFSYMYVAHTSDVASRLPLWSWCRHRQEIPQHRVPILRQDRLRMKLHPLHRQRLVPYAHDHAALAARRHL